MGLGIGPFFVGGIGLIGLYSIGLKADVRQKDMDLSKDYVTEWRTYIAEPLQREVGELRTEVAQLRHAIQQVGECDYRAECPVLRQLQHESHSD